MEPLNYDALVATYWDDLTTQLRGFRPAAEFLDLWVPDEDHVKSIINMLEAAQSAGQPDLALYIEKDTVSAMDLAALIEAAGAYGDVRTVMEGNLRLFEVTNIKL
jgi:hypothetical protein